MVFEQSFRNIYLYVLELIFLYEVSYLNFKTSLYYLLYYALGIQTRESRITLRIQMLHVLGLAVASFIYMHILDVFFQDLYRFLKIEIYNIIFINIYNFYTMNKMVFISKALYANIN